MFGGEIERIQSKKGGAFGGGPGWLSRVLWGLFAIVLVVAGGAGVFALLFARGEPVVVPPLVPFIITPIRSESPRLASHPLHRALFDRAAAPPPPPAGV